MDEEDYAMEGESIYFLTDEQAKSMERWWREWRERSLEEIRNGKVISLEELKKKYNLK